MVDLVGSVQDLHISDGGDESLLAGGFNRWTQRPGVVAREVEFHGGRPQDQRWSVDALVRGGSATREEESDNEAA